MLRILFIFLSSLKRRAADRTEILRTARRLTWAASWPGDSGRTCLHLSRGPLRHAMARWRKVMICARVQVVPGSKVVEVVPWVTPLSTAQATASA